MDTIFALATAPGKAGVAVIRVSGPESFRIGGLLCGALPGPGQYRLRTIRDRDGEVIDRALVLTFRAPASFTGDDVIELQTHGSMAVVRAIESAIHDTGLARPAEAGEFTKSALLNGKLDLTQVEALGDLIASETEAQRRQAMRVFDGELSQAIDSLRADLLRAMALVEATIDFADEEVPVDVGPNVKLLLRKVQGSLEAEISGSRVAERVRNGFEVALIGPPNVGKSTLLNRMAGRDIALTSRIAGTTRDVLEVDLDLSGMPVTFLDTAGLRESEDEIEQLGIAKAKKRSETADIRVHLFDGESLQTEESWQEGDIACASKADLTGNRSGVSGLTGDGVDRLLAQIGQILAERVGKVGLATHVRHRMGMERALLPVNRAVAMLGAPSKSDELVAEELRMAVQELNGVVAGIDVESVLGEIFSQFCIGK